MNSSVLKQKCDYGTLYQMSQELVLDANSAIHAKQCTSEQDKLIINGNIKYCVIYLFFLPLTKEKKKDLSKKVPGERTVVCKSRHIHYNGSLDKGLANVLFVENIAGGFCNFVCSFVCPEMSCLL